MTSKMNRLGTAGNRWQGDFKRVLCVCSAGILRSPEELTVISLWRPWCFWVMLGWKTIETRTHDRFANMMGKRIGIHAAQKWDDEASVVITVSRFVVLL